MTIPTDINCVKNFLNRGCFDTQKLPRNLYKFVLHLGTFSRCIYMVYTYLTRRGNMKKIMQTLVIVGILVLSGIGTIVIGPKTAELHSKKKSFLYQDSQGELLAKKDSIVLSEPVISEEDMYATIQLEEATSLIMEPRKPILPALTRVFTFPLGTKINSIDVTFSNVETYILPKKVKPASEPVLLSSKKPATDFELDKTTYTSSELYPKELYTIRKGAGLDGNEHVIYLMVQCHPIRYSPAENIITEAKRIDITVKYQLPEQALFSNDEYDMVIIAPNEFSSAIQPLIDHKNSYGVRTILKTTEKIYEEYNGCDQPEQIKYFIKDALEKWGISYILLVGSIDKLPIRKSAISWYNFDELPTDLYYADIYDANGSFCNWDSNGNGRFSEFIWDSYNGEVEYIDFVDLFPDIGIGRLPCINDEDVNIIIDKIITYETQSYGQEWLNRLILMGGDTFPNWGGNEGEIVTEYISEVMPEFNHIKLWTSTNNFKPRLINREISMGASFVSYSGHGYEYGFGTSPPDKERRIQYYTPYILGISNDDKLPVIFFDACLTATLDLAIGGLSIPCFAWSIVKKPNGGAVASIGATRVAYASVIEKSIQAGAPRINANFFEAYEPGTTISHILTEAQNNYINYCWKDCLTLEEFNLLGDPSLKIGGYP